MKEIRVSVGLRGPDDYIKSISEAGGDFGYHTRHLLRQCNMATSAGFLDLVLVRGGTLHGGYAYVWQIYERADRAGLGFCPAEAAAAFFLERPEYPEVDSGKIRFASEGLPNSAGYLMQFEIFRGLGGVRFLSECDSRSTHVLASPDTLWVFSPKKPMSATAPSTVNAHQLGLSA